MIRTSIILSPRLEASDRLYFHANGLQVDVAMASQLIVRTSHRPVQIYSANREGIHHQAPNLTAQTGTHALRWQRMMDILDRQGADALVPLQQEGDLTGEWIVALDENRLNALLSERFTFFLFREGQLRELNPVATSPMAKSEPDGMSQGLFRHYRISVNQDDQIIILPQGMIPAGLMPESEAILSGIQQLPVRLSDLGSRLRERGVTVAFNGWIAIQILRAEAEYRIQERGLRSWLTSRRKPEVDPNDPGFSDDPKGMGVTGQSDGRTPDENGSGEAAQGKFSRLPHLQKNALILLAAFVLIAVLLVVFKDALTGSSSSTETTVPVVTTSSSVPTPTTTASTTTRPTTTATTTAALPEYFVIARRLNLREEPDTSGSLIRTLTTGESVFVLEQASEEWSKVRTADGEIGYVYSSYISMTRPAG